MTELIPTLKINQPYAALVAAGRKRLHVVAASAADLTQPLAEWRRHRGLTFIEASQDSPQQVFRDAKAMVGCEAELRAAGFTRYSQLPRAGLVAVVQITHAFAVPRPGESEHATRWWRLLPDLQHDLTPDLAVGAIAIWLHLVARCAPPLRHRPSVHAWGSASSELFAERYGVSLGDWHRRVRECKECGAAVVKAKTAAVQPSREVFLDLATVTPGDELFDEQRHRLHACGESGKQKAESGGRSEG